MENEPQQAIQLKLLFWKWWRGIDQQIMVAILLLLSFSLLLVTTSSASVANRIGVHEDFFTNKHIFYVLIASLCLVVFSALEVKIIKNFAILAFAVNLLLLFLVNFSGYEIKGAKRWINIAGFSLQPSEFIKPFFAIIVAIIFSKIKTERINLAFTLSALLYFVIIALLILQPDLGMVVTLSGIWALQLFIAGIPYIWIIFAAFSGAIAMFAAYKFLPHVTARIDSFLNPTAHENYQVSQALKAFYNGGLFGRGPGEGIIKHNIPDSHSDFIFAVAGEEFGIAICIFIVLIFAFIILRTILLLTKKEDGFIILASSGIIAQFAIQSIINMGVSLNMLPTKGMTLPFISYGGSSTISVGISMGILLALSSSKRVDVNYTINKINY